tara:strand:- start:15851 stop:16114 length:264 start_codon:yes stop_codon:yes gene_type:complete
MTEKRIEEIIQVLQSINASLEPIIDAGRPFLNYKEAAGIARCRPDTIQRLVSSGKLKKQGFSSQIPLVRRDELLELLNKGEPITGVN